MSLQGVEQYLEDGNPSSAWEHVRGHLEAFKVTYRYRVDGRVLYASCFNDTHCSPHFNASDEARYLAEAQGTHLIALGLTEESYEIATYTDGHRAVVVIPELGKVTLEQYLIEKHIFQKQPLTFPIISPADFNSVVEALLKSNFYNDDFGPHNMLYRPDHPIPIVIIDFERDFNEFEVMKSKMIKVALEYSIPYDQLPEALKHVDRGEYESRRREFEYINRMKFTFLANITDPTTRLEILPSGLYKYTMDIEGIRCSLLRNHPLPLLKKDLFRFDDYSELWSREQQGNP